MREEVLGSSFKRRYGVYAPKKLRDLDALKSFAEPYSSRNAFSGSICAARRAGT
jgi:hypothetical protein